MLTACERDVTRSRVKASGNILHEPARARYLAVRLRAAGSSPESSFPRERQSRATFTFHLEQQRLSVGLFFFCCSSALPGRSEDLRHTAASCRPGVGSASSQLQLHSCVYAS